MRNSMDRKRDAVLYANLAHQFGDVGFDGALPDAQWGAYFLVRLASHQPLQNFFLAICKRHLVGREDGSGRTAYAFNEHREYSACSPDREPWLTIRIACTKSAGDAAAST